MERQEATKFVGIIPARYGSTRLDGKPLRMIHGKSMIQRVYEQASKALEHVFVATDDERIIREVESFGGNAIMTSATHNTGTNRCMEAAEIIRSEKNIDFEVVINVQGDEPMLEPDQVRDIMACFEGGSPEMATLVISVSHTEDLFNQSEVFVTYDNDGYALYFSRATIPYLRDIPKEEWLKHATFYKHLGMYAYTFDALKDFAAMKQTDLEKKESLEQLRWLENGRKMKIGITEHDSIPVDTKEDLERVIGIIKEREG
ncbi:3-deoxy-manno-octulosonate cytidylyltransferase [Flammeovirgaceae bacterium SG7u.111]|nr:3-deoxy-manno-octulosonate cytidylyltransferase [Flammeovirgaceae bacterium SG7u.132]WPO37183.1 3-deoxy-manno-octulosonate cytidylyltransferase [Flammeovirgaceae bacterium SG7u.111]